MRSLTYDYRVEVVKKTADRRFAILQTVWQPEVEGNPTTFKETWKAWQHHVDVCENLAGSKLDDDVKVSVVLREAPKELQDNLLVNSQLFESNNIKLRSVIQAYLNSNNGWIYNARTAKAKTKGQGKEAQQARQKRAPCVRRRVTQHEIAVTKPPRQNSERGGGRKNLLLSSRMVQSDSGKRQI